MNESQSPDKSAKSAAKKLEILKPNSSFSLKLVATRDKTFTSNAIRFFDAGQWSHIAVVLANPDGSVVYESRERVGVRATPLLEWELPYELAVIEFELSPKQFARCEAIAKSHLGKAYDYQGVSRFVFPLKRWLYTNDWQDRLFCSEYAGLILGAMLNVIPHPYPSPNGFWYFWSGYKFKEVRGNFMQDDTQAEQNTDMELAPLLLDVVSEHNLDAESIKREVVAFESSDEISNESRLVDLISLMSVFTVAHKLLSSVPDEVVETVYNTYAKKHMPVEIDTMIGFIWGFGGGFDFSNLGNMGRSTEPVAMPAVGVSDVSTPLSEELLGLITLTGLDPLLVESPIVNFTAIESTQTRAVDLPNLIGFITNANDMMYGIPKIATFNIYLDYVRPRLPKEVSDLLDFLWLQRGELLSKLGLEFPSEAPTVDEPVTDETVSEATEEAETAETPEATEATEEAGTTTEAEATDPV